MQLQDFFRLLWPTQGYKFIVQIDPTKKYPPRHIPVATVEEAAEKTQWLESRGGNVFFSCGAFAQPSYKVEVKGELKTKYRERSNSIGAKAFWLDMDVGPTKDYASFDLANATLDSFLATSGLPAPLRVCSGNGLHAYWPIDTMLPVELWERVAKQLHTVTTALGLKSDPSRDRDITSVLRPPHTHNRKAAPLPVNVIDAGAGALPVREFVAKVANLATALGQPAVGFISGTMPTGAAAAAVNCDLALPPKEYPPSSAEVMATKCKQVAYFRDTGSDSEPHWRACLGLLKHTQEGEALAHKWSKNYDGYSEAECQEKLDRWQVGPTTCEAFGNFRDLCDGCALRGKITSPIMAGTIEKVSVVSVPTTTSAADDPLDFEVPTPFTVHNEQLCAMTRKDGVTEYVPFCDMLFFPVERVRDLDGTMALRFMQRVRHNGTEWEWREFRMPSYLVAGGAPLAQELAKYEIVPTAGGRKVMDNYVAACIDELRRRREELRAHRTCGWQEDDTFVIGKTKLAAGAEPREIVLGGTLASGYARAFDKNGGSASEWVRLIEEAYGRPGHEQYQFCVAASFGSMLVDMCGIQMGGPINLYGARGKGKSTAAAVALSVWGDPDQMSVADPKQGTSSNALYARMSAMHSFPYLVDEITMLDGEELAATVYHIANARPKDTLDRSRRRQEPLPPWGCLGFMTSNASAMDKLSSTYADASAQMTRILEIEWRSDVETISPHRMARILDELADHYGSAGRQFAQYVLEHRETVKEMVRRAREKLDTTAGLTKEYRFWSVQLACTLTAALVANRIGLFPFPVSAVHNLALDIIRRNKRNVHDRTASPIDSFHSMLTAFAQQTITTAVEMDGREGRVEVRMPYEPVARIISGDGVAYLSIPAIREWCAKRHVGFNTLRQAIEEAGYMINHDTRYYLGKGTTVATGQSRCWKVDWRAIQGSGSEAPATRHLSVVK